MLIFCDVGITEFRDSELICSGDKTRNEPEEIYRMKQEERYALLAGVFAKYSDYFPGNAVLTCVLFNIQFVEQELVKSTSYLKRQIMTLPVARQYNYRYSDI